MIWSWLDCTVKATHVNRWSCLLLHKRLMIMQIFISHLCRKFCNLKPLQFLNLYKSSSLLGLYSTVHPHAAHIHHTWSRGTIYQSFSPQRPLNFFTVGIYVANVSMSKYDRQTMHYMCNFLLKTAQDFCPCMRFLLLVRLFRYNGILPMPLINFLKIIYYCSL